VTADLGLEGGLLTWAAIPYAAEYAYTLKDKDGGAVLASGSTPYNYIDLSVVGLTAFNYTVTVQAIGDGVVYLDGSVTVFDFYTDIKGRFTAKAFASMTPVANNAFAEYDEESGAAVIQVANNGNWGGIVSLEFDLNFDINPLLVVKYGEQSLGGWYMQIRIDGQTYYLADNTFTFGTVYLDLNAILAARDDGLATAVTGVHRAAVVFGATMGEGSGTPRVYVAEAHVYQLTGGTGEPILGELAKPVLTISGKTVSWATVPNAQKYVVIISNEYGVLINTEITGTSYDFSVLIREGQYGVSVTAIGERYYNSETAAQSFEIKAAVEREPEGCSGCGTLALFDLGAGGGIIAAVAAVGGLLLLRLIKRKKSTD
jgi:hypothetical protein